MKLAAFNAVCPFEIGDKIGMRKNACAVGGRTLDVIVERTITDIVCMHSVKAGIGEVPVRTGQRRAFGRNRSLTRFRAGEPQKEV